MIKISKISPLLFDIRKSGIDREAEYMQRFKVSDGDIIIQCIVPPGNNLTMTLVDIVNNTPATSSRSTYTINNYNVLYEFTIPARQGVFKAYIEQGSSQSESLPFSFCQDNSIYVDNTILVQYTNIDNITSFGALFDVNGIKRTFKLRIEGGFKTDSTQLAISNEQFRTQRQEIIELYAVPYEISTLTIGNNEGVPFEMARLLNNILCLSDVLIDGVRYVRSESSVPEQQVIAERYPLFNYQIALEQSENVSYRGYTEYPDGTGMIGNVSFNVKDAKDGEVLVFKDNEGSFINQDHLESQ